MRSISLHPTIGAEVDEFLTFETDNHAFFTRELGLPDDNYYTSETVAHMLAEQTEAWKEDRAFHYLIRDREGQLVGHIQLFNVQRGLRQRAELGYRVGAQHGGKGYASAAVQEIITQASRVHRLYRLESFTVLTNLASQKVLLKNGFNFFGRAHGAYRYDGRWVDTLCFERLASERGSEQ